MDATVGLRQDHEVIKQVLATLGAIADRGEVPVATLRSAVAFSQDFVDRCHHGREESCLFPCLERCGVPRDGPIAVMLMEHEMGRKLVRSIAAALDRFDGGQGNRDEVLRLVGDYVDILEQHIYKEDHSLFEMGRQVMGERDIADTLGCDDRTEAERGTAGYPPKMAAFAARITGSPGA